MYNVKKENYVYFIIFKKFYYICIKKDYLYSEETLGLKIILD